MTTPAADAAGKLRLVLDYVPCEMCLSVPTKDQEILCSICARVHRRVGVTVARRTSVIVERPAEPEPVVIPPAAPPVEAVAEPAPEPEPATEPAPPPEAPEGPPPVEVVLYNGKRRSGREGRAREVVIEPFAPPPPPPPPYAEAAEATVTRVVEVPAYAEASVAEVPRAAEAPLAEVAEAPVAVAPEPEPEEDAFDFAPAEAPAQDEAEEDWDDVASFSAPDDGFDYEPPERAPEPEPARAAPEEADVPEDDFVFRAPAEDEAPPAPPAEDDAAWAPAEEVPVEPAEGERSPWAPPEETDFLAEEAAAEEARAEAPPAEAHHHEAPPEPAAAPFAAEPDAEEEILETEIVEMEIVDDEEPEPAPPAEAEEEILETEIVEMEIVEDDAPDAAAAPAPAAAEETDLQRLRGFDASHQRALAGQRIERLAHLSGHDPNELADRTGIAADLLTPWVQVADLVTEVGVPIDAAVSMVAAGVPGPRGLADMDEQTIVDRVQAFGNASISTRDVKRWKRRV